MLENSALQRIQDCCFLIGRGVECWLGVFRGITFLKRDYSYDLCDQSFHQDRARYSRRFKQPKRGLKFS